MKFLFVFFYVFLELYCTIAIGKYIGALGVLSFFFLSAFLGFWLLKKVMVFPQNFELLLSQGVSKEHILLDRFLLVFAALLFIIPGFFSSFVACLLFIPLCRRYLQRVVSLREKHHFAQYFFKNGHVFYQKYEGTFFRKTEGTPLKTIQVQINEPAAKEKKEEEQDEIYDCDYTVIEEKKNEMKD